MKHAHLNGGTDNLGQLPNSDAANNEIQHLREPAISADPKQHGVQMIRSTKFLVGDSWWLNQPI